MSEPASSRDEQVIGTESVELEPVDSVQRNFDKLAVAYRAVLGRLQRLEAQPRRDDSELVTALRHRCEALEEANRGLTDRVEELERQAFAPPSPKNPDSPTSDRETLASRVLELERRAETAEGKATAFEATTHTSFGDVWSEIRKLQQQLADTTRQSEEKEYVTRDEYNGFTVDMRVAVRRLTDESAKHTAALAEHTDTLSQHSDILERLLAEQPRGDELRAWLERLDASVETLQKDVADADMRITDLRADVSSVESLASEARQHSLDLAEVVDEKSTRLTNRLDRLATSVAKSLKALDDALAALRKQRAAAADHGHGAADGALITKVPCLSCDPSTAAELRPDAVSTRRPKAPKDTPRSGSARQPRHAHHPRTVAEDGPGSRGVTPF